MKNFTLEDLAQFDGQSGRPAYVAVDGVVYDVSNHFEQGEHYAHLAGHDLSVEFNSQHPKDFIAKYPVVGKIS